MFMKIHAVKSVYSLGPIFHHGLHTEESKDFGEVFSMSKFLCWFLGDRRPTFLWISLATTLLFKSLSAHDTRVGVLEEGDRGAPCVEQEVVVVVASEEGLAILDGWLFGDIWWGDITMVGALF